MTVGHFLRRSIFSLLQPLYDAGQNAGYDCSGRDILRHDRALAEGVGLAERSEPAGSQEPERPSSAARPCQARVDESFTIFGSYYRPDNPAPTPCKIPETTCPPSPLVHPERATVITMVTRNTTNRLLIIHCPNSTMLRFVNLSAPVTPATPICYLFPSLPITITAIDFTIDTRCLYSWYPTTSKH